MSQRVCLPLLASLLAFHAAPGLGQTLGQNPLGRFPSQHPSQTIQPLMLPPSPYPTELESRLEIRDRLVVEQRRELPGISLNGGRRLVLETVVALEYGREQERVLGVRATVKGGTQEMHAYLDLHEVEDLLRALQSIPTLLEATASQPEGETEIRHVTQDGFGVVLRTEGGRNVRRYLRLGNDDVTHFPISKASAEEFSRQLHACRQYLFDS